MTILRTGWSNFREIPILNKETGAEIDIIDKRWEDTIGIKFGGNYVFSRSGDANHRVRGGIFLDESPIPADTLAPDVPDGEGRTEFAVGYGYKRGGFLVDVSYFLILFKDSTSTNPDFAASYSGDVTIISASVGYHY